MAIIIRIRQMRKVKLRSFAKIYKTPTPLQHQIIPRLFFQLEKWEGCTRGVNEADPGEAPGGGRPH